MNAYFAGGCFWCMEKPYHQITGVLRAVSGYCGGEEVAPTYEEVKAQKTMHRETVWVEFDEKVISFSALLDVFFASIDPFDAEGQFIDRGRSYTTAVYYVNDAQKQETEQKIRAAEEKFGQKIAVSVELFRAFYPAEEYHQNYAEKNPEAYAEEYQNSGRAAYHAAKEEK